MKRGVTENTAPNVRMKQEPSDPFLENTMGLPDFLLVEDDSPEPEGAFFTIPMSYLKEEEVEPDEPVAPDDFEPKPLFGVIDQRQDDLRRIQVMLSAKTKPIEDIAWKFETAILAIAEHIAEIKALDFRPLTQLFVETFELLLASVINEDLQYQENGEHVIRSLIALAERASALEINTTDSDNRLEEITMKLNKLLPPPPTENVLNNQRELREYLAEKGINTTGILIQLCSPRDLNDFLKAVEALEVIFNPRKHDKTNYIDLIKDLNDMDDNNGARLATPFFLLKKAKDNCVIKAQYNALLKVLSKAINIGFFNDDQERQVNDMIDEVAFKGKRAPLLNGKNAQLVVDQTITRFDYVVEYLKRNQQ